MEDIFINGIRVYLLSAIIRANSSRCRSLGTKEVYITRLAQIIIMVDHNSSKEGE